MIIAGTVPTQATSAAMVPRFGLSPRKTTGDRRFGFHFMFIRLQMTDRERRPLRPLASDRLTLITEGLKTK
jgi:hypothetical protein